MSSHVQQLDDHTLYTDLLECRVINHELNELWRILKALRTSQHGQ